MRLLIHKRSRAARQVCLCVLACVCVCFLSPRPRDLLPPAKVAHAHAAPTALAYSCPITENYRFVMTFSKEMTREPPRAAESRRELPAPDTSRLQLT